jgi:hypothetical protein
VQRSYLHMTDCRRDEIRNGCPIRLQIDLDQEASMAVDFVLICLVHEIMWALSIGVTTHTTFLLFSLSTVDCAELEWKELKLVAGMIECRDRAETTLRVTKHQDDVHVSLSYVCFRITICDHYHDCCECIK